MELVNNNGTIQFLNFICLDKNEQYSIIETKNTHKGNFWHDTVWKSEDLIKRLSDGKKVKMTRDVLKKRFKNVQIT